MLAERKQTAYQAFKAGDPDRGLTLTSEILNEYPDDITALFMAGEILASAHRYGLAGPIFRRVIELEPEMPEAWHNLGHCLHVHHDLPASIECFAQALKLGGEDFHALSNMLLMNTVSGDHANAIRSMKRVLFHASSKEEKKIAESGAALAYLALGDWENGWRCFDSMLGTMKQRKRSSYLSEGQEVPDWDGNPLPEGQILAIYGEQGIGDEIMFASMLPEVNTPFVVECEKRLTGLFQRSFGCASFGTRLLKDNDPGRDWRDKFTFGAKVAIGSLGKFYRKTSHAFPKTPYLQACPVRRQHIREALKALPGKKVGLAWTGGLPSSRGKDRTITPESLKPLLDAHPEVTFISLEYKGKAPLDPRILHWPELTQSQDYDDTAALVSELDAVVSVTTTVALLCGALGQTCHVLVPEVCTWHWAGQMPWFGDHVRLYRRKGVDWTSTVEAVASALWDGTP